MKRFLFLMVVLFVTPCLAETFKWSQLGRAPLMGDVRDKLSLQEEITVNKEQIIEGLKLAEPTWNAQQVYNYLEEQSRNDTLVKEESFPPGKKFIWMIFKPAGKVGVVRNVQWCGQQNLKGFIIPCLYQGMLLDFFVPQRCGNICLARKEKFLPPEKPEESVGVKKEEKEKEKVVVAEKPVYIEKPVIVEKEVVIEKPVIVEKEVVIEKPVLKVKKEVVYNAEKTLYWSICLMGGYFSQIAACREDDPVGIGGGLGFSTTRAGSLAGVLSAIAGEGPSVGCGFGFVKDRLCIGVGIGGSSNQQLYLTFGIVIELFSNSSNSQKDAGDWGGGIGFGYSFPRFREEKTEDKKVRPPVVVTR
ncbi:MAG: hypothetical protein QME57_03650 [Patescibacteria group bacterium]|nr:hypothetical protein [Patescibacteria group bacterium]